MRRCSDNTSILDGRYFLIYRTSKSPDSIVRALFKTYLTALYQVETPRQFIEFSEFQYEYIPDKQKQIKKLKDKIKSAKAKITQNKNKIKRFETNWNELFPYDEYPLYKRAVAKVNLKKSELFILETKLKDLTTI